MSTVHCIDEEDLTEAGQDGTQQQSRPARKRQHIGSEVTIMNSKFLYAATVAVSLISTLAMADEAQVTRAQVNAELRQAVANGTLQRSDYGPDADRANPAGTSTKTRAQVGVELAQAKAARATLTGPDANRTFNPYGTRVHESSTLARSDVNEAVREAAANGTLQRTDYDYDDAAQVARNAKAHAAGTAFAQRVKAKFPHKQS
jgi:hypothetical protein